MIGNYLDIQTINDDAFDGLDGAIIVPNHEIGIDGLILAYALSEDVKKQTHFLVQNEGVYSGKYQMMLWATGQIPVNVDNRSKNKTVMKRVEDYLEYSQDLIGIFSEGPTKNLIQDGKLIAIGQRKHELGAAHFSIRKNKPIIPIAVRVPSEVQDKLVEFGAKGYQDKLSWVKEYTQSHGRIPYIINIGTAIKGENKNELTQRVKEQLIYLYDESKEYLEHG
jgi:1-acyl-sn-glycerol-3-phosphate acyltransferase